MPRNCFAINTFRLFAEPFKELRSIGNLTLRLSQRLFLLSPQNGCRIVSVFHHQVEPFPQDIGTIISGPRCPVLLRSRSPGDRAGNLFSRQIGHFGDYIAARPVYHVEGSAAFGVNPISGQLGPGDQQA